MSCNYYVRESVCACVCVCVCLCVSVRVYTFVHTFFKFLTYPTCILCTPMSCNYYVRESVCACVCVCVCLCVSVRVYTFVHTFFKFLTYPTSSLSENLSLRLRVNFRPSSWFHAVLSLTCMYHKPLYNSLYAHNVHVYGITVHVLHFHSSILVWITAIVRYIVVTSRNCSNDYELTI